MKLRVASINDIQSIYYIEKGAFKEDAWTKDQLMQELSQSEFHSCQVLDDDGDILGYIMTRFIADQYEIINLAINPKKQKQGLGHLLLDLFLNEIHDDSSVYLEVKRTNFPAINLYLNAGFEEIAIREKYYQDGEDAIIMKKDKNLTHVMV